MKIVFLSINKDFKEKLAYKEHKYITLTCEMYDILHQWYRKEWLMLIKNKLYRIILHQYRSVWKRRSYSFKQ
jgi:hypothetical protein